MARASDADEGELEVDGHFWLPSDPDKKVAGTLTFNRDNGGSLSLIGSFADRSELFDESAKNISRIYGETDRKEYTLDACFATHSSISFFGGVGRQQFRVGRVVEDAHIEADMPVLIDRLIIDYTYLLNWTGISGTTFSITEVEGQGVKRFTIESTKQDAKICSVPGGKLTLRHSVGYSDRAIEGQEIREYVRAEFEFDSVIDLDDALDVASDFQDLLTVANDKVVAFEAVYFGHPDLVQTADGPRRYGKFYTQWQAKSKVSRKRIHLDHDMCFTFTQIEGIAGVERWMELSHEYRSQLGRVMSTRYSEQMMLQDRLLGRVAALESWHKKRWPDKKVRHVSEDGDVKFRSPRLSERLEDLTAFAGPDFLELFGEGDEAKVRMSSWRRTLKDERNDIAHHLGRSLHQDAAELYYVSEGAYWLFVIVMMVSMSAPRAAFTHLGAHRRFNYVGRQLQSYFDAKSSQ